MLQLTKDAATFIRDARVQQGYSEQAALRIHQASDSDRPSLRLGFVDVPPPGDQVGETEGIPVCVASPLVEELEDKVLDMQKTDSGVGLVVRSA